METPNAVRRQADSGGKPCDHDNIKKEYYLGAQTGDYVCTVCGRDFSSMEEVECDRRRQREQRDARNKVDPPPDA